jgi:hypothetical protein
MATIYIDTNGDWDDLTSAAVDGDTIIVQSGSTAVVNQTPKFLPALVYINDGTLLIDGANGTSPILMPFNSGNSWSLGTSGRLKTTEGWWSLGTCHGTAYSDFNLTDYWYKTTTGGSRLNDVACYLPGIWVETGKELHFTGGTGTLPNKWDYVHNTSRVATPGLDSSAGTNFGPVVSVGTAAGDPTTGTLVVKWMLGTNAINDPIEVRKVDDVNGPYYRTTWSGTLSQAPILRHGIYSPFQNSAGTKAGDLADISMGTLGNHVMGFQFHTYPKSTLGTFGNGIGGILPDAGANIRVPIIKCSYIKDTTERAGMKESNPLSSSPIVAARTGFGDVNLNGVLWTNSYCQAANLRKVAMNNFAGSYVNLTSFQGSITGTHSNIVLSKPHDKSVIFNHTLSNVILDDVFIGSSDFSSNSTLIGNNIKLKHWRTWQRPFVLTDLTNNVVFSGYYSGCEVDDIHCHGILQSLNSQGFTIRNFVSVPNLTGGTTTATSDYFIDLQNVTGDIYVENIRQIVNNYRQRTGINLTGGYMNSLKLRAIGNPAYKERWFSQSENLLEFGSAPFIKTLDIARVFLEHSASSTFQKYLFQQTATSQYVETCKLVDIAGSYSSTFNFILQPQKDGYFRNIYNPRSTGISISVGYGLTTIQPSQARSWGSWFASDTVGFINCRIYDNTDTYTNYEIIQSGTSGATFEHDIQDRFIFKAGAIVEFTGDTFLKGHTGFDGSIGFHDASTIISDDWTGGTVGVYFKYDTGGTGFNPDWLWSKTATNWTGLSVDPSVGVKLKFRLEASDTDATNMAGISVRTTTSTSAWLDNLEPIDQTVTTITLQNVVAGSRYWIYNTDSSTLLTSGVAAGSTVTYEANNLPNGTNLKIRVRYASTGTKYLPFETNAITSNLAANVYISQVVDTIVT